MAEALSLAAAAAGAAALVTAAAAAAGAHPAAAALAGALGGAVAARLAAPLVAERRPPAPPPPREGGADALAPGLGRALLERLPLGLLLIDREGRVMYQNPAALDVFERALVGLPYASALRAPALTEAVASALTEGRAGDVDVTLVRVKERVVHAAIRPLPPSKGAEGRSADGRPAVLLVLEDRTRAAKAESLRRDFVAYASHELKTPLASISGFIETLQGHARSDPAATERFLKIMAQQTERMKRLVEDLLSLNRIEINEHVRPRDHVDVATVAWEVAGALAPLAEAAGARIAVELPREGLDVLGSRDEIAQLFVNLIDNAVKYAGQGGPIRVVAARGPTSRPGMIGVSVIDRGPGVAREHIPRLTERFYRVDTARSRERGGTGLGLAIAKHIVNRHRGDLAISSTVGEGSTFTVWLPVAEAASATDAA